MKKHLLIPFAIAFQVLTVASIAITKERLLATGQEIILQTAPIDPRDIFKGDYVRLDYSFSKVPVSKLNDDLLNTGLKKGQKVFLSLDINNRGIAQGNHLSLTPPQDSLYLVGRVKSHWPYHNYQKWSESNKKPAETFQPVMVKYGLEQYFVEQGSGLEMEKIRGTRNSFQVPMLMHVAVSDTGDSVIRSFKWANIAMKTETKNSPENNSPEDQASAIMSFTIKNRSDKNIQLPWKLNNCSFILTPIISASTLENHKEFERPECTEASTTIKTLKPEEEISLTFDLNLAQWYVNYKDEKTPMGRLPWGYRYRIVYQEETAKGINANIISSAFHGRGNID